MALSRRRALAGGAALGAGALLAGCDLPRDLAAAPPARWGHAPPAHWRALGRLTFGPRPEELARAAELGLPGWVEEQLAPEQIDDAACELRLRRLDTPFMDVSLAAEAQPESLAADLRAAAITRAVFSRRQLFEALVDFWGDHFSVSVEKEGVAALKVADDREVIRRHAFGRFDELLWASMTSPAMLVSLDNQRNGAGRPNENYARELLELHTLGLAAGYTQRDVQEAARCLTGWTVAEGIFAGSHTFDAALHDGGAKRVLGVDIPAGAGQRDAERLHAAILAHPALPGFIAAKLARRLVGDPPPPAAVARGAAAFRASRGDIRAVLRAILLGPELPAAAPRLKRPLTLVAGALRQLGAETDGGAALQAALAEMGQPLFAWPTPDGFPEPDAAWATAPLPRWRFAVALAGAELPGTSLDLPALLASSGATTVRGWLDRLGELLLGAPLPGPAARALEALAGPRLDERSAALALAGVLAAPHYQWR